MLRHQNFFVILFFSNDYQFKNKENFTNQIETKTIPKGQNTEKKYKCFREGKTDILKTFTKIKDNVEKKIPKSNILQIPSIKEDKSSKYMETKSLSPNILGFFFYIQNILCCLPIYAIEKIVDIFQKIICCLYFFAIDIIVNVFFWYIKKILCSLCFTAIDIIMDVFEYIKNIICRLYFFAIAKYRVVCDAFFGTR